MNFVRVNEFCACECVALCTCACVPESHASDKQYHFEHLFHFDGCKSSAALCFIDKS